MHTGIVIQARFSSARLPGKVLRPLISERPILSYLVETLRAKCADLPIVLATSCEQTDDAVVTWCEKHGVPVVRGPLEDVMARFLEVARQKNFAAMVRINGDSPLLDGGIVRRALETFRAQPCDLVTNTWPRSFPKGQSVEIFTTDALARAYRQTFDKDDLEHVTRYFYRNADKFRITNFSADGDYGHLQLSVDTGADFARMKKILAQMQAPHWQYTYKDMIQLHQFFTNEGV